MYPLYFMPLPTLLPVLLIERGERMKLFSCAVFLLSLLFTGVVEAKEVVIQYDDFLTIMATKEHRDKLLNQCKAGEVVRVQIDKEKDHKIQLLEGQVKNLLETAETQERLGATEAQINEALQKQLSKVTQDLDREKRFSRYKSETVWIGLVGLAVWMLN